MNQVCVIEGLGAVGKSKLVNCLGSKGLDVIKEISEEESNIERIQMFSLDYLRSRAVNEWFIQKEVKRMYRAKNYKGIVFLDRCIYSQIAYNYAKDQLYGSAEVPFIFSRLEELENKGIGLLPPMIYLSAPVNYSMKKMRSRNKNVERRSIYNKKYGYTEEFFMFIKQTYDRIAKGLEGDSLKLSALQDLGDLTESVISWSGRILPSQKIKISDIQTMLYER